VTSDEHVEFVAQRQKPQKNTTRKLKNKTQPAKKTGQDCRHEHKTAQPKRTKAKQSKEKQSKKTEYTASDEACLYCAEEN